MTVDGWKCAGCGTPSPKRVRSCECPTNVVSRDNGPGAWKIDADLHRLSETIRTRLLGVTPEDQDVVLEDADWNLILKHIEPERI